MAMQMVNSEMILVTVNYYTVCNEILCSLWPDNEDT